jgi:hypothetical protein
MVADLYVRLSKPGEILGLERCSSYWVGANVSKHLKIASMYLMRVAVLLVGCQSGPSSTAMPAVSQGIAVRSTFKGYAQELEVER